VEILGGIQRKSKIAGRSGQNGVFVVKRVPVWRLLIEDKKQTATRFL